jgi:hypothetical protein
VQLRVSKTGLIALGAIAAVALIVLALPVSVPYTISAPGKILAAREWIVSHGADGRVVTRLLDRARGVTNEYTVSQFERGDAFEFHLSANVRAGALIRAGDTIGIARSAAVEQELARLQGELESNTALLALNSTGDKQSVVAEAKQQLAYAERQAEVRQSILERQKSLFERNMISQQEYEIASREAALSAIDIQIAKARLQSVTTGAKREQVVYDRTRMLALQREIVALERRRSLGTLVAPLTGIVMNVASNDTLLIVADTAAYVVMMPVGVREREFLSHEQPVALTTRETGRLPNAVITTIDNSVYTLNAGQVVFVTALLDHTAPTLLHGLTAQCTIECTAIPPREFVARTVRAAMK